MHANTQRQLPALTGALLLACAQTLSGAPEKSLDQQLAAASALAEVALATPENADERAHVTQLFAALEKEHPHNARVKNAFAEFLWSIGDQDAAMSHWRDAAGLEPRNAVVLNQLGGAQLRGGNTRAALRCFADAVAVEPSNALYHFNLANVAFMFRHDLGFPEEKAFALAMEHFAAATQCAPAEPEYARAYAEAFYMAPNADWCSALAAWQHFYELSPKKDFALLNIARVHMKLGQKAEARECLARVTGQEFARLKNRLAERIDQE
jgi:Tfp pilus assembly protein PilF